MEKYLVLYRSTRTVGDQMAASSPEEMQASQQAWMEWGARAGAALVDFGAPTMPIDDVDPGGAGWVGGYSFIQAENDDALAAILEGHPHADEGTIEVVRLLPMPGA